MIPIKVKWLGYVNAALLLVLVMGDPKAGALVFAGMLPYVIVFGPEFLKNLRQSSENAVRRQEFQKKASEGVGESFHECSSCGKTDTSDPDLEFRVISDGEEYCINCLPSQKNDEGEA